MAPFGKVYTYPNNPRAQKIQAAAKINGLEIEIAPGFEMGKTNKTPEFLAKFPTGKVPAFEGAAGVNLVESDAIMQYVAESGPRAAQLVGKDAAERARVQQWVLYQASELWPEMMKLLLPRAGFVPFDEAVEKKALDKMAKAMDTIERALEGRSWLALDTLSIADLAVMSVFTWGFKSAVDEEMRSKYPKLMEWFFRTLRAENVNEFFPTAEKEMCAVRQIPS
ncbi:Glutathione S-transferase [Macrophomina phaseolina MS6]|uniref:Glutathione S-transferase n=2 Tax=Macrophomina phaseolina TaxID=35725 RepID=K2SAR7_MACPH|nr:Glutathione S-transferase [Macrophomina phaseolina MS6]KAH7052200.1 glutathione S-transferase [Macrophomina phaseolina]